MRKKIATGEKKRATTSAGREGRESLSISKMFKHTQRRIRQVETDALRKLRGGPRGKGGASS